MDTLNTVGIGAGSGILGIIIYSLFKFCYKKHFHTNIKSDCCETSVDVSDNTTPK